MNDTAVLKATTVATGVSAGMFFAFSTFVMPALDAADPQQAVQVMQLINEKAPNPALVVAMFGPALTLPYLAYRCRNSPHRHLLITAAAVYLVGLVGVSIGGSFPLNDDLATVHVTAQNAAQEWHDFATPWKPLNHVRTLSGIVATAALAIALHRTRREA